MSLEITIKLVPTPYLRQILEEAEQEYTRGESIGPFTAEEFITFLKHL